MRRTLVLLATLAAALTTTTLAAPSASAATPGAAPCSDVELVVAKGTLEPGILGVIVGDPLFTATKKALPGRSVTAYDIAYPALPTADSPRTGVKLLVAHLQTQAAACPAQKFVLVGYSQGAQVVEWALGTDTTGTINGGVPFLTVPAALAPRVAAITLFGDPLQSVGRNVPAPYTARTSRWCWEGDPVCQAGGGNVFHHLLYFNDTDPAAQSIAARV